MKNLLFILFIIMAVHCAAQAPGCSDRKLEPAPTSLADYLKTVYRGYHVALVSDFAEDWCAYYDKSEYPHYITADYDGDGKNEFAFIMITKTRMKVVLVVVDELENGEMKPYKLDETDYSTIDANARQGPLLIYGLKNSKPGKVLDHTTGKKLDIATAYITQYYFGKAATSYYWTGKGYRKIITAD